MPLIIACFHKFQYSLCWHESTTLTTIREPHGKRVRTNRNKLSDMQQQLSGPGLSRS